MSLAKQFNRTLDELWRKRTAELRAVVTPQGRGRPATFSKVIRQRYVDRLLEVATRLLVKREGKKEFRSVVERRLLRFVRGRGLESRFACLLGWARRKCDGPIVYVFWRRKKCLYVGKGSSWRRLRRYDRSAYLIQATCLEVFCIKGKSHLGKAECLATHLFKPRDQRIQPAKQRWGKACPVCRKHDQIRKDLRALFKLQ